MAVSLGSVFLVVILLIHVSHLFVVDTQASIILFEYILIPILQYLISLSLGSESGLTNTVWFWLRPLLSYTFGGLWILPLFCLSRVINIFWFQDVANSAFRGRIRSMNFPTLVADTLYSLVIQALFLLQVSERLLYSFMVSLFGILFLLTDLRPPPPDPQSVSFMHSGYSGCPDPVPVLGITDFPGLHEHPLCPLLL